MNPVYPGPSSRGGKGQDPYLQYDQPIEDTEQSYYGLSVAREALNRVFKPKGTHTSPGRTCRDIKYANPEFKNGEYYIDPNEGTGVDAIKVYCNFDMGESCVLPSSGKFEGQRWTKNTREGQYFMDEVNGGKEFHYEHESNQLKMLQLLSSGARQTVAYNCLNSSPYGARFTTSNDLELDSTVGKFRRSTFIEVTDGCDKDNQWHTATFSVRTNMTEMLPLVDMLLFDIGAENQKFGIQVGQACFS